MLRWKLGTRRRDAHHERPCWDAIPRVEPAVELSLATPPVGLTWVGHSTVLMLLPIHWGSFVLSDEPLGEPPAWLEELAYSRGLSEQLHLWPLGGTLWL